jgi:hypothetical protein
LPHLLEFSSFWTITFSNRRIAIYGNRHEQD